MKKLILINGFLVCFFLVGLQMFAQVGINSDGSPPDPSAMLDVKSGNKGFLPPRVELIATSLADPVNEPTPGLLVYNTAVSGLTPNNVTPGYYCWDGVQWVPVIMPKGINPGDMLYWNGSQYVGVAVGTPGQLLGLSTSSVPVWTTWSGLQSPAVLTANPTSILQKTFTTGGNVVSDGGSLVTDRGICYSVTPNPSITSGRLSGGIGTGVFSVVITGLSPNTLYYTRAYAINAFDTVYGDQVTATTLPVMQATIITLPVTNITQTSATCGGNILSDGGADVYFRGVCWDTLPMPTTADSRTDNGTGIGSFVSYLTGLVVGKTYYVRAYAVNYMGPAYGNQEVFNTSCGNNVTASVSVSPPNYSGCAGTSVTFTATPVNGGSSPAYQWKVNGVGVGSGSSVFTYIPSNLDQVSCVMNSNEPCVLGNPATSNIVNTSVNPVASVGVSVVASSNNICSGTMVTFTASAINGGTSPQYQWQVNGTNAGSNSSSFSCVPVNGDLVKCILTSNATCVSGNPANSAAVSMVVIANNAVSLVISPSSNPVCTGTVVNFTVNPTNPGTAPVYQWKVNGTPVGTNSVNYSYVPANNDVVTCSLTSSITCPTGNPANSNAVSMTVNLLLPVSVSVSATANPVCSGTAVTFTSTPVNGGTNPLYQWKKNTVNISGATNSTYTYTPANNDIISNVVTSNATCTTGSPAASGNITMTVTSSLPVSVSISASANPVCSGTSVTFTATPVNGGTAPSFQWMKNGVGVSGATNVTYSFAPVNSDAVSCVLTSNNICGTGSPATSNTINMTVSNTSPVSVSISASANPVCSGTSVTFTATPVNGGTNPAYQWRKNSVNISGATNPTYSYIPLNNDVITCVLTSNGSCTIGSPAVSNAVPMSVNSNLAVGLSISASANPVCSGTSVTFTALPVNGGSLPVYQWRKNGIDVTGATNPSYAYIPENADAVTCVLTSNVTCGTGNPATSNTINMTVNITSPVSVSISPSANPVCSGTPVTFTATPVNGGTNPAYQWQKNTVNISGATNPTYSYIPVNNDGITCVLTSNGSCTTGNPAVSNAVPMSVNSNLAVGLSISASANPVCSGTSVTFTALPVNGGSLPVYQWRKNGIDVPGATNSSYVYTPENGDAVTCVLTSNVTCGTGNPATSNTINMTVNITSPVSVSISPSANPVCSGTSVTFTATPVNGGTNPAYQWKKNTVNISGATNATYSYIPMNNDVITCVLTSNGSCISGSPATSSPVTMNVNSSVTVGVSINVPGSTVCAGTSVTFTATPVNGGTLPVYQWKKNGANVTGATNVTYVFVPLNGDIVTCIMTSNVTCGTGNPANSNSVTMTVNPVLPVSVSIGASGNPVCAGTSVTFTATPVNGGSAPGYQWKKNTANIPGATNVTYSYTPSNGDALSCILTSNATCISGSPATSNIVTMSVNAGLPVSVLITSSSNPVCSGTSVTFTAAPTNGGTAPAYQWKVNGVNVGTNNSTYGYTPLNGDLVTCVLTSNETCATSNPATSNSVPMIVNTALPVGVSIVASANPVCDQTMVTYTATPVNGGSAPVYEWKVNGSIVGSNSPTYSAIPANGAVVTCSLTSSAICVTGNPVASNSISMTVNPQLPVSVSVSASQNPVCQGNSVIFTATPVNGGTSPVYQWKLNGSTVGGTGPTYVHTCLNGETVSCLLTSNALCPAGSPSPSNTISMTVNPTLPVSVSVAPSANPVCAGTTVTYTATPVNGGSAPVYQWKVNGTIVGQNLPTYSYIPVNGDQIICTVNSNASCTSGNPAPSVASIATVNPSHPVSIAISASQNPVCSGSSVTFSSTSVNGGTAPAYQWKKNGITISGATNTTYTYDPANGDVITNVLTSNESCPTGNPATSNQIAMTVNSLLVVDVTISPSANPVCAGTSVTFTANPVNGGTNPAFQWKVNNANVGSNSPNFTCTPLANDVVFCVLTSNLSCVSVSAANSNTVTMTVNDLNPVSVSITANETNVCAGTSVTFNASAINGGSAPSWQWRVNGVVTGGNSSEFSYVPSHNDVVNCIITSNVPCPSGNPATSNAIIMIVNPLLLVSLTITASENGVCSGTLVTFTTSTVNGGSTPAYDWIINDVSQGINDPVLMYVPANNDVVKCLLNSNALCATGSPAISNGITMSVVEQQPVSVSVNASANPVCTGSSVTFTAIPVNGGNTPVYLWKVNNVVQSSTLPAFTFNPQNNDAVTCQVTSNAGCISGNPAISAPVIMSVNPLLPVSVTVTPSANPVCSGSSVTFTASPNNPGSAPVYQWKVDNVNVGENSPFYTFIPASNNQVSCLLTSNALCTTGNPAVSNIVVMTVNTQLYVGSISEDQTICSGTIPAMLHGTPPTNGTSPTYQWEKSLNNIDFIVIPGATELNYQPGILSANNSFRQLQNAAGTCGGPLPTNMVTVSVNQPQPVEITITANPAGVVFMDSTVTFTANPVNGGNAPIYEWKVNGQVQGISSAIFAYVPANNDMVTCTLTSNASCISGNPAESNAITVIVSNDPPVTVTIAAEPSGPICQGTQVLYTATPGNQGENPVYQWKVNGVSIGSNSPTLSYTPSNGDAVICVLLSSLNVPGNPATSNTIQSVVNPLLPVSVAIAESSNPVCNGTQVTFTATVTNGGTAPAFNWAVNGSGVGIGTNEFIYTPANGDLVNCSVLSDESCASGNPAISGDINMVVNSLLPVGVSISASANPVCAGASVSYTAVPVNGGPSPSFFWKLNGMNVGSNDPVLNYNPSDNDVITCVVNSNASCTSENPATSNAINMSVTPTSPVSVSISTPVNTVCAGTMVTVTAIPVNGGSAPGYQWKVNGNNVGSNSSTLSYAPSNGDVVTCELTSNETCPAGNPATSNSVVFTVNPLLPVSLSITGSANPVCSGTSVEFTTDVVNGGVNPLYQWKVNGTNAGSNNPVFSVFPGNNDAITCVVTSDALCATQNPATSNEVVMTVNQQLPVSITVIPSGNSVCAGTSVTFTAIATNAGTTPVYEWKVNGQVVGTNSIAYSYAPSHNDVVTCSVTGVGDCLTNNPATSDPLTITVIALQPVSVTISPSGNSVCAGTTVTYTATPVNGGTTPSYLWKVNEITVGSNQPSFSYVPLNNDQVICMLTSNAVCPGGNPAQSNTVSMTVNSLLPVSVSVAPSANPVCAGTSVTFTATPVNGGTNPGFQWKVNGVNSGTNNSTFLYTPVQGDVITCIVSSSADCSSGNPASSNPVTMVVNPLLPVSVTVSPSANNVCSGVSVTFTATPVNGGNSPAYQWKKGGSNITGATNITYSYAPFDGDLITCQLTSNAVCPTGNPTISAGVTMTVNPSPAASVTIAASANPVCSGTSVTYTATPVNGGTTPSYQWKVNGANQGTNSATYSHTPAVGNTSITCVMTSSLTCVSQSPATSGTLTMTVNPILPVSVTIAANPSGTICQGVTVTFTATPVNGGTSPAYQWKVNGTNVSGATDPTYSFAPANGNTVICVLTSSGTCISGSPATSNTYTAGVTPSLAVSASVWASSYAVVSGTSVTFNASRVNGGTAPTYQWYKNNVIVTGATNVSYSYAPANNDNIKCIVTSNLSGCLTNNPATSNIVNMIVYSTGAACAGIPTVVYGGMTYNTVQIGTQCWLRENLNIGTKVNASVTQTNNSIIEKYCYNNDTNYCNVYGGLYQWAELVQYLNGVTNLTHWNPLPTGNVKGLCPTGWHLPTYDETMVLINGQGGLTLAGGKMKETGLVHWGPISNVGATNTSGFTSIAGGYMLSGAFNNVVRNSYYWTITKGVNASAAYYFGASFAAANSTVQEVTKITGEGVRCLKD